jgi:hypothetical protein
LDLKELVEIYNINKKIVIAQSNEYFETYYKKCQKKKKESA